MVGTKARRDPYRTFKFRVVLGVALAGLAAVVIAKKASSIRRDPEAVRRNAFWRLFGLSLK